MPIEFSAPSVLLLLLSIPLIFFALRFSLVDSSRRMLRLSAACRAVIVLLLVLALAGTLSVTRSRELAILVLADVSRSVSREAEDAVQELLKGIAAEAPDSTSLDLAYFSSDVHFAKPLSDVGAFPKAIATSLFEEETNIEHALRAARQGMKRGKVNRVVLLSDGNETMGSAIEAAKRSATDGVRIFTYPYPLADRPEVLLDELIVPAEIKSGQSFSLNAVAHSTDQTTAEFTLFRNGAEVAKQSIALNPGANTITFDDSSPPNETIKYELRVRSADDSLAENNVASGIVFVAIDPRVLLLASEEREARYLSRVLKAEQFQVDLQDGSEMPDTLSELEEYDVIILANLPATDITSDQMELLRSYVEDSGGGLIMVGGLESFGLGGYYRTPIAEALPVRMESKKDKPSLAFAFLLDKSGSMKSYGYDKMDLAKEAAISTLELLSDRDYLCVIGFDQAAYRAVEMQSAANRAKITELIERIQPDGGTNVYAALDEAYRALKEVDAKYKHAILLTDGHSHKGDFEGTMSRLVGESITVSCIAVGEDADRDLVKKIAERGGGRSFYTKDPKDIPQIFTKDAMAASRSAVAQESFRPQVLRAHQAIRSIDWRDAPELHGYIITTPKATAELVLVTESADPLFATWRFGLGKAAAFTSDASNQWAADWLRWPEFGKFWVQVVRDTMRTTKSLNSEITIVHEGSLGTIKVDSIDSEGNFRNDLTSEVQVITPSLDVLDVTLEHEGPGRYSAAIEMPELGSYVFNVRQRVLSKNGEEEIVSEFTRGFTLSYKPEYRQLRSNTALLGKIASVTGGGFKAPFAELFTVTSEEAVRVRRHLWPWLLAAALILFVADVALRRLDLARRPEPERMFT